MADYTNTMLCWNDRGDVALVPWPDTERRAQRLTKSGGAAYSAVRNASFDERKTRVFIDAVHLIVRDGCDPHVVHRALLGLDEYRDGLAEDMPGAV